MATSGKKSAQQALGGDDLLAAANLAAGILAAQRGKPDYKQVCRDTVTLLARIKSELNRLDRHLKSDLP